MNITLGQEFFSIRNNAPKDVIIDYTKVVNPHMIIVGPSGVGKTYNLRNIIKSLINSNSNTRFHILDVHGDIDIENNSTVKFSETTNYGLQPLKLSSDPDFGGVRKRIRSFIGMLNQTNRKFRIIIH
jgi:DNA helicase HerA-like ATPase